MSHIYVLVYMITPILVCGSYNIKLYNTIMTSMIYICVYTIFTLIIILYMYILDIVLLHVFRNTKSVFRFKNKINSINFIVNNIDIIISTLLDNICNVYVSSIIVLAIIITTNYITSVMNYMYITHKQYYKLLEQKSDNDHYTHLYTQRIFHTAIVKEKVMMSTLFINLWCIYKNTTHNFSGVSDITHYINLTIHMLIIQILIVVCNNYLFNMHSVYKKIH